MKPCRALVCSSARAALAGAALLGVLAAGGPARADPPRRVAPSKPVDPIEQLSARLAEKLGATVQSDGTYGMKLTNPARPADSGAASRTGAPASAPHAAAARAAHGAAAPAAHGGTHWEYEGAFGPQAWASLKPEYATCASGQRQSPIDLRDPLVLELDAPGLDYRPSRFTVVDNGHTVQVDMAPGNMLEVMGRRFELVQFHFHRPSEERIDGRAFDMSLHLVHKDAEGRLAVVAVLLERGSAHPAMQLVWNHLPLEKHEPYASTQLLDPASLLPASRAHYLFMGSLTTPPCTEGVLWVVLREPVQLSDAQARVFARLYPYNARPVQPLAGRLVKASP